MISLIALLPLLCLFAPQLRSDDFSELQLPAPAVGVEVADDIDQTEDSGSPILELPTISSGQEYVADRPTLPSPPKLSTTNQVPAPRVVEQVDPSEPQPLRDPDPLEFPYSPPTQLPSSAPAPRSIGAPANLPPARTTTGQPPQSANAIPADMKMTAAVPVLSVETQSPAQINVGKTAKYTIDIKNHGEVTAENVQIYATLPERVKLIEADPQPTAKAGGDLRFDIDSLAPNQGCLVELKLVPRETGPVELIARASFSITARSAMQVRRSQLMLTCEGPQEANYGDTVTFNLVVTNVGDGIADGVVILPQLSAESVPNKDSKQSMPIGWLRPGASQKIPFTTSAIGPGKLEARFTATDASGSEANATANFAFVGRWSKWLLGAPR